ncbi:MAG TPA: SDR family NAD(P)-dependent oxidoreductase [Solirubrobacteraceae bacterium]
MARSGAARRVRRRAGARRVALVTGGSGALSRAVARRLARDGLAVAVNDFASAADVVDAIRQDGGIADAFSADVTDERQVAQLAAAVADSLGPVEVLVLGAADPQPEAPLAAVAWEDHVAQLELFVKRPVLLGRALLPGMTARRSGRIVQVDAEVLDRCLPGRTAYATARSAQMGLIRSWARALAPLGITVNTVAPALVPGDGQADLTAPTRRAFAQAVSFVASEAAASVTGQRIVVDGGRALVA